MRLLQVLNVLAFAAMVIVNYLAVFLPINGQTTGDVARQYPSLFIPAGFIFIIWRLIYLLLFGFVVYQAGGVLKAKPDHPRLLARVGIYFILSSMANLGWILMWHHHQIGLALVMNAIILLSLFFVYMRLEIGKVKVARREWFFTHLPFSIYLGWVTISAVGNLSVFLVSIKWDGWGLSQTIWTVLAVFSLAVLGLFFLWSYRDRVYALTFVWVYAGVFYQRIVDGDPSHYVIGLAAALSAILLLAALFIFKEREKSVIE